MEQKFSRIENPSVSVIIPVLNEESILERLLLSLISIQQASPNFEVIVVDGGSSDRSVEIASDLGAILVRSPVPSRSIQCNLGASFANGSIFFFLHADCLPRKEFISNIMNAVQNGSLTGCFRIKYDEPQHWWLKINAYYKALNWGFLRFGDQGLFLKKQIYFRTGGYSDEWKVMEDAEYVRRLRKKYSFSVLPDFLIVSSRKFQKHGLLKLQFVYFICTLLFAFGFGPTRIERAYQFLLGR
ncbi:glycosyl transferase [Leptospira perolatii]|uniref:Glycosyl transferase n=1 Tax=Leptospira perolatii TaxID=2023191 RepID=A0A2M9ZPZ8_9LEPT|nr:glycosyl transferase [Leptospira perolatii]PJZ74147.1 glycosyl transferase [Leptospira perolatii]